MPKGVYKRKPFTKAHKKAMSKARIKQLFCDIEGCNNKHQAKGLCQKHYFQKYKEDNKEYYAEWNKQYAQDNKEHCLKIRKQYYLKNKEKENKRTKQWREDNEEYCIEYSKQYSQDNKKKIAKRMKQYNQDNKKHHAKWYLNNKEHIAKRAKQYRQTPAGKAALKAGRHNYRTLQKGLTKATVQRVYEDNIKKYGTLTCCLCFKPIVNNDDSIDHATPLTREGTNNYDNLGVAHFVCNCKKHTLTLREWFCKGKFHLR